MFPAPSTPVLNQDVLSLIAQQLVEEYQPESFNGKKRLTRQSKLNLLNLALSCRLCFDPAMDVLWRKPNSFFNLICTLGLQKVKGVYILPDLVTPSALMRYRTYNHRVRVLNSLGLRRSRVDAYELVQLFAKLRESPCPTLHTLQIQVGRNELLHLFHLSFPALTTLSVKIETIGRHDENTYLDQMAVWSFPLCTYISGFLNTTSSVLSTAGSALTRLHFVGDLTASIVKTLAAHAQLKEVSIELTKYAEDILCDIFQSMASLPHLQSLSIAEWEGPFAMPFTPSMPGPRFSTLIEGTISGFLSLRRLELVRICGLDLLKSIFIYVDFPALEDVGMTEIWMEDDEKTTFEKLVLSSVGELKITWDE